MNGAPEALEGLYWRIFFSAVQLPGLLTPKLQRLLPVVLPEVGLSPSPGSASEQIDVGRLNHLFTQGFPSLRWGQLNRIQILFSMNKGR